MCFSPEVDLTAGVVLGAVGIDALRHTRDRRELPLASLPALFAVHQLSEAFVWWDLTDRVSPSTGRLALWVYMLFAYVVLPVLAPGAITAVETDARRRRVLTRLTALGALVAVVYLSAMMRGPIGAVIQGHSLYFDAAVNHPVLVAAVYVVVACGSPLVSSHRDIRTFGFLNVVAVAVLSWVAFETFASLWCLWAAITSIALAAYLRHADQATDLPAPAGAHNPQPAAH